MKSLSTIKRCTVLFAVVTLLALPQAPFAGATPPIFSGARAPAPPVPQFLVPPIVAVSATPSATAAADFNGDGKIDLAVTTTGGVDILLGNGDGTFQAPMTFAIRGGSAAIAVADMNNDGRLDLVTTTVTGPGSVHILLGNGDGTFQPAKNTVVSNIVAAVAVGDFNGDGKPDVVVAQRSNRSLGVLLGNGDGTLQPEFNYAIVGASTPTSVAVGDFNNDGKLDIVAAAGEVNLLLGNGDGTFKAATEFARGSGATQLAVTDINGDGLPDVIINDVSFGGSANIGVLLGKGDGTFQNLKNSSTGGKSLPSFALADFNGDGKLDAAICGQGLGIMIGNGDGTFHAPSATFSDGGFGGSITAATLVVNGHASVIQTTNGPVGPGVALYMGSGDGTLQAPRVYNPIVGPALVAIGDFNGDGRTDVAVLNSNLTIGILLGNGNGTFQNPLPTFASVGSHAILAFDVNGDGKLDLIVLNYVSNGNGEVVVFLGNGDGTFQAPMTFDAGFDSLAMAVRRLTATGPVDIVVVNSCINSLNCQNGTVGVLVGNGDGTFRSPVTYNVGEAPNSIAIADFNKDGNQDLAVADSGGSQNKGNVSVLLGNGDGTFQAATSVSAGIAPQSVAAADFNGDHITDLVVANPASSTLSVLPGNGNGTFKVPIVTSGIPAFAVLTVADLNGDGKPDIALQASGVDVLVGNGNGTFQPPIVLMQNIGATSIKAAVLAPHTLPDLIVGDLLSNSVAVILNTTP